jgi:hypothetical protein
MHGSDRSLREVSNSDYLRRTRAFDKAAAVPANQMAAAACLVDHLIGRRPAPPYAGTDDLHLKSNSPFTNSV